MQGTDEGPTRGLPDTALESELIAAALTFARRAHAGQIRKGDGSPYIDHPGRGGEPALREGFGETVIAAALLHDVVEDCGASPAEIEERFGPGGRGPGRDVDRDDVDRGLRRSQGRASAAVKGAGSPATAIYAADKLANLRSLSAAYRVRARPLEKRFNAPLDEKENARKDTEMLETVRPRPPYLAELRASSRSCAERRGKVK